MIYTNSIHLVAVYDDIRVALIVQNTLVHYLLSNLPTVCTYAG
jgi:hypothetical protein